MSASDPPVASRATVFGVFDVAPTISEGGGVTSPEREVTSPERVDPNVPSTTGPRYHVQSILGRGGMGEVQLCRDERIGREVAVKIAHRQVKGDEARARFLREARIQAQLEHPAIVPVHDIDVLDDGSAYFAMKRVRGVTLAHLLQGHAKGDAELMKRFPQRKLLNALVTVCQAVELAHARGVVHRDLKPGNVMLGDFGEVYVLDWGLAKVIGRDDDEPPPSVSAFADTDEISDAGVKTEDGRILGTPGYMAPEQLDASLGGVSPSTDVYALGALLFEILTLKPIIEATKRLEIIMATLKGVVERPSTRAPELQISPELDELCVRALARDPRDRLASAAALREGIELFLAGEQDLERRRALALRHVARADAAMHRFQHSADDGDRSAALRELGAAIALDADNVDARRTLARLLTEPPSRVPEEVRRRIARADAAVMRTAGRLNAFFIVPWLLFLPIATGLGVLDWTPVAATLVLLLGNSAASLIASRQEVPRLAWAYASAACTCLAYVAVSRFYGPLVLVPGLLGIYALGAQNLPDRRFGRDAIIMCAATLVATMAAEAWGLWEPSYAIADGGLLIREHMVRLGTPALWVLFLGSLLAQTLPAWNSGALRRQLSAAEEQLHAQRWWLEQLVPRDARVTRPSSVTTTA